MMSIPGKWSKERFILKTNLEAAEELVRQIGLRNLSGMIIVDFINLKEKAEEEQLVSALKNISSRKTQELCMLI